MRFARFVGPLFLLVAVGAYVHEACAVILTVTKSGTGTGTVTSNPAGIDCGTTCSANFSAGLAVNLVATPSAGGFFTGWSGGGCSGTGGCTVTMNSDVTVTANFSQKLATTTTVTSSQNPALLGVPVTYTATVTDGVGGSPTGGFIFRDGTGVMDRTGGSTTVTMFSATTHGITAEYLGDSTHAGSISPVYEEVIRPSTRIFMFIDKDQTNAGGLVQSSPAGISCNATRCDAFFYQGDQVTLTATPASGSYFVGWSGVNCPGTGTCQPEMVSEMTVHARFARFGSFAMTISSSSDFTGPGQSVTFTARTFEVGSTGSVTFVDNTTSTVLCNAVAVFGEIAQCTTSSLAAGLHQIVATYTGNVTRTATTAHNVGITLNAAKAGNGTGTVTSSPPGINCEPPCSGTFAISSSGVTFSAVAANGSTFIGWSGGGCGGTGTCTVAVNSAAANGTTVTAAFNLTSYNLTVAKVGTGAATGTVTSAPVGIDCGTTCSANFSPGTPVALTATTLAGTSFTGWSGGACSGTGTCSVTMNAATSVTATFANPPRLANISTRMQVLTGENVLIGGLTIDGTTNKTVVIRARGPSLSALGVPGVLANPVLQLFSGQTQIDQNDNWSDAANATALQASGYAPPDPLESAILTSLAPGAYTAIVSGVGGGTGVGLVEVFEVDGYTTPLINIASRGQVLTGSDVVIAGFIIQGSGPQTVVVRARGPSLAAAGVAAPLADPMLQLFSGQTQIAVNDNWQTASNAAALSASGFAPSNPLESAILITLNPGAYTAIVTGANGGTGVGIVEVFAQ